MKGLAASILLMLATFLPARAGERVMLFAQLKEKIGVELSDGAKWNMDRGDCFPVVAYKEQHTRIILQLASATFMVPADKIHIVPDKDIAAAVVNYRSNVNTYINGFAARWRAQAERAKTEPEQ